MPGELRQGGSGAGRRGGGLRLGAAAAALLLASGVSAVQGQEPGRRAPTSSLSGRLIAEADGAPIPGAEVLLERDSLRTETDRDGIFRFDAVTPGEHVIRVRRLGFRDRSEPITVPVGALVDVTLTLATEPVELQEIVVVVRSPVLAKAGFYERQKQGYSGEFMDRAKIERRNPDDVTDLFQNMRGLRVVYGGLYGSRVLVNQQVTFRDRGGCEPTLWIDGTRSTMRSYDMMRVEEIEGIEVYTGEGLRGPSTIRAGPSSSGPGSRSARGGGSGAAGRPPPPASPPAGPIPSGQRLGSVNS